MRLLRIGSGTYDTGRLAATALFAAYFFRYALRPSAWHLVDAANLIFHEAGHAILRPFGEFAGILGGSAVQVAVPAVCAAYFFMQRKPFSGSLLLFWLGQNLMNVSVYAGDAARMQLPLLGGDAVIHDWNYLLTRVGLLDRADGFGGFVSAVGLATMVWALWSCIRRSRQLVPDSSR